MPITSRFRLMINDDIDAIIQVGEERTVELNNKYETLNLEDLSNFKSEASVQQWEGEDFRTGVSPCPLTCCSYVKLNLYVQQRKQLGFGLLSLSKRERKANYSVDSYFKDTLRAGPAKTEKVPKLPRAPKQITM
jgi:SWI/SNF-related matrix-associated actin-dependent regulator of chromatin subfamily A member 5